MENYAMLYEELCLAPWGGGLRRSDPFQLADADTFRAVDNELSGKNGVDAKFGLFSAITKTVADNIANADLVTRLRTLQDQLSAASTLHDLCQLLLATKEIFQEIGFKIIE